MEKFFTIEENMKGKVAFMTGATSGIGKATVEIFVQAGVNAVFVGRNEKAGKKIEEELNALGKGKAVYMECDMTDHARVKECIEETVKIFGRLDTLFNCAGYFPTQLPIDMIEIDDYKAILELNLVGYFVAMKYAMPYLRTTKGSVINVGSVLGTTGDEGSPAYCSSKGGIQCLTRAIAIDEARNGVRVNELKPGHINTELFLEVADRQEDRDAFIKYSDGLQWLGRGGRPEECGYVALFLASDYASFITGEHIHVSGGFEFGEGPKLPNPAFDWGPAIKK